MDFAVLKKNLYFKIDSNRVGKQEGEGFRK